MRLLLLLLLPFSALCQTIIYHESCDGSTIFNTTVKKQTATTYGITQAKDKCYTGTQSARFELRDTDPEVQSGTRAEIVFPETTSLNRWYSFAMYAPSGQYKYDTDDDVITQWHQGGGKTPALCLRVQQDKLYIRILGTWIKLCAFEKDVWRAYVMHVKHSAGSDGLIEIWKDGVKIMNRSGANMYKIEGEIHNPNLKMGIYKSQWNGNGTSLTKVRVLYFDDIRVGSESATFADMCPK